MLILRPQEETDKDDCGFRYLPFWIEEDAESFNICDYFIQLFDRKMSDNVHLTREIFIKKSNPPTLDLRYSDKFFSTVHKSKTMSFRFGKRFKMDSMIGTFSPLSSRS